MLKIVLYEGLPACGKSTDAIEFIKNNKGWKRVNKDLFRDMLDGGVWSGKNEDFVLLMRDQCIMAALEQGFNVIVDDTNLHPKHLARMLVLADELNLRGIEVKVEEKQFFDVPLMTCIERDAARANPVGRKRIFQMWEDYLEVYRVATDLGKPHGTIVDVDGTLADKNGRKWTDYTKVRSDRVHKDIADLVALLAHQFRIYVVSGRDDSCRADTEAWLKDNLIPFHRLYMRKTGDHRPDWVVKKEIYENDIEPVCNIDYVLDDRDQVVWMWRQKGLRVLQVNYGPF